MEVLLKITFRDVGVTGETDCKNNVNRHRCDR